MRHATYGMLVSVGTSSNPAKHNSHPASVRLFTFDIPSNTTVLFSIVFSAVKMTPPFPPSPLPRAPGGTLALDEFPKELIEEVLGHLELGDQLAMRRVSTERSWLSGAVYCYA